MSQNYDFNLPTPIFPQSSSVHERKEWRGVTDVFEEQFCWERSGELDRVSSQVQCSLLWWGEDSTGEILLNERTKSDVNIYFILYINTGYMFGKFKAHRSLNKIIVKYKTCCYKAVCTNTTIKKLTLNTIQEEYNVILRIQIGFLISSSSSIALWD